MAIAAGVSVGMSVAANTTTCVAVGVIGAVVVVEGVVPAVAKETPVHTTQLKMRTLQPMICIRRESSRNQRQNR